MSDTFWTRLFLVAGIYNLLAGLPLLFAPSALAVTAAGDFLFLRMTGALVVTFGIGYFMVASDLVRHRSIAVLGTIGKLAAFALLAIYMVRGAIPFRLFLIGVGDLIFAVFFIRYLQTFAAR
ncbi:MAG: hypothetical protein U1F24_03095 [Alphaproteobacteria bacterium]